MCCRCDRTLQGGGGSASRFGSGPLVVCYGDGQTDEGDLGLGVATVKHGVSKIDPNFTGEIDWNGPSGRWFLGLYSNDSDHVKNRITVKDLDKKEVSK